MNNQTLTCIKWYLINSVTQIKESLRDSGTIGHIFGKIKFGPQLLSYINIKYIWNKKCKNMKQKGIRGERKPMVRRFFLSKRRVENFPVKKREIRPQGN